MRGVYTVVRIALRAALAVENRETNPIDVEESDGWNAQVTC